MGLLGFALQCFDVLAWPLFALLYPLYSSYKAIETNSISDTHKLNTYWVVFSLILLFEHVFMKLLQCFSLWPYMRLLIVFFLEIPHFDGALYVFKHLICPCLSMDPQILFSLFKKRTESLARETVLSEVERYVKENGNEGLEKLISFKSNGNDINAVEVMAEKKETTANQDEDFVIEKDDAGSPTDDSGDEGSDASESGGEKEKPAKKDPRKEPSTSKVSSSKKKSKEVDEDGPKKKKQKKKKDPKAPKSGFMFFWSMERENVKTSGRVIRDKWMKMSAEEKKPYEAKARQDKLRYKEQLVATTRAAPPQPMNVSEAEPILTFNKDRSSSMQMTEKIIEVAADSGVLETPPSKKVQKESNPVSALATQTDAKTIELAADRGILKTPPPKKVQGELTAGCLPIQTDATLNSPLDGNKHKATYEAMKINKEAKPNLTLTENHTVPAVKINEKPVQVGIGMEHSQSSKQVQKEWTCALCQVTTIREQDLNSHLQGRKHKASYDALIASNQAFVPTIAPASTAKTSDQPNKEPGKSIPSRGLKQKVTSNEPVQAQKIISRRQRRIQQWHEEGKSYTSREGTKSATEAEFPVVVL